MADQVENKIFQDADEYRSYFKEDEEALQSVITRLEKRFCGLLPFLAYPFAIALKNDIGRK